MLGTRLRFLTAKYLFFSLSKQPEFRTIPGTKIFHFKEKFNAIFDGLLQPPILATCVIAQLRVGLPVCERSIER